MRVPRIYTTEPLDVGVVCALGSGPSHHIAKVLRMQPGRELIVFNGDGNQYRAYVDTVNKKAVHINVSEQLPSHSESPLAITLGVCLIKNDRFDWLLQKATELGVTAIVPLNSHYTDVKLNPERLKKKQLHWQQVIISACEQSGRTTLPTLFELQPLVDWVGQASADTRLMLHPYSSPKGDDFDKATVPNSVAILVGPEGGLSEEEVTFAARVGFQTVMLGPRILRAETAPLAAITLVQSRWGDIHFS